MTCRNDVELTVMRKKEAATEPSTGLVIFIEFDQINGEI
jgi:hypothetical protein